uniref:Uncharacterized protein n=1 Tax=Arundo donax TaxID=35708 RepID=A0A0A9HHV5_ARUDO
MYATTRTRTQTCIHVRVCVSTYAPPPPLETRRSPAGRS